MSKIVVYEGNSVIITYTVTNPDGTAANLAGFTATITVKASKSSDTTLISKAGVIDGNTITFTILASDNDNSKGTYYHEATIESATQKMTIDQDRFIVKESLIYIT